MKRFYEISDKVEEYNWYIREHRNNVLRAWKEMQQRCKNEPFVYDDWKYAILNQMVETHDLSKYSTEEFSAYRQWFYPCEGEERDEEAFNAAWKSHYENEENSHHWEHWVGKEETDSLFQWFSYVTMILDWVAMGYKFGDTALEYYERNKDKIWIEPKYVEFVERILKIMS